MSTAIPACVTENVPLASLTTLEVGGPARYFAEPASVEQIREVVLWAGRERLPLYPLGGGSNVLASDQPFPGIVMRPANDAAEVLEEHPGSVLIRVGAGKVWDDLAAFSVEQDWAGLECLSGIPGRVGASPMQNIGAYGQEAAQTIEAVEVMDISDGSASTIAAADCAFAYRSSRFKTEWRGRFIITAVQFRLTPHGQASLRYRDLQEYFADAVAAPSLDEVRQAVLEIRRRKSMLYDTADPNHRSAGSFFLNPIVTQSTADSIRAEYPQMPVYPAEPGYCKLSAAWLIANSGFKKGFRQGRAKLSDNHVLCLVNAGGAEARELLDLARTVREGVEARFSISLAAEPNLLGIPQS